ncbi:zinc finger protein [Cardiosporidium cionae]|uniref:Zinc finger protein n=1 Tax=Cardiosporidium cionae TaxID=476202 RepID=A0ABQ7JD23_9APIC|nr:zinc finger protein [Cardiosporidium cionae]|eukprot:KAF8821927.1 zinc finger protein [Cardiosporidium cionae]
MTGKMSNISGSDVTPHEKCWSAVHPNSDEWKLLEYMLHVHVRTSRVKLKQAWQVAPPHLITNFQKRCGGILVLHSFVDTFNLDEKNSIQDICRRGFKIEKCGMKFSVGNFSLPGFPLMRETNTKLTDHPELASNGNIFTPIVKKASQLIQTSAEIAVDAATADILLGVGKSFVSQNEFHAMGNRFSTPPEYDSSFLLESKPLDASLTLHLTQEIGEDSSSKGAEQDHENFIERSTAIGVLPQYIFKHDYVIYDTSQVLPRYLIQFECDPAYPENFCLPLCDNCQDAPSLIWCASDNAR